MQSVVASLDNGSAVSDNAAAASSSSQPLVTRENIKGLLEKMADSSEFNNESLLNSTVHPTALRLALLGIASKPYLVHVTGVDHELVDCIIANAVCVNSPTMAIAQIRKGNYDRPSRVVVECIGGDYSVTVSGFQERVSIDRAYMRLKIPFPRVLSADASMFPHDPLGGNEQLGMEIRLRGASMQNRDGEDADAHSTTATTPRNSKKRGLIGAAFEWLTGDDSAV
jgi:hypothetical protein